MKNNTHGFPQHCDEHGTPTCTNCGSVTEANRGQGTECQRCIDKDDAFMEDCRRTDICLGDGVDLTNIDLYG